MSSDKKARPNHPSVEEDHVESLNKSLDKLHLDTDQSKARSKSPSSGVSVQAELAIQLQMSRLKGLQRQLEQITSVDKGHISRDEVCRRSDSLVKTWELFSSEHVALSQGARRAFLDHAYITSGVYDQAYETYDRAINILAVLLTEVSNREPKSSTVHASSSAAPKLPEITLPTFNGDLMAWPSFRDTFSSLVIRSSRLTKVEMLHYLKASLTGAAAQIISSVPITNEAFDPAWERLTARFEHKDRLTAAYVERLLTAPKNLAQTAAEIGSLVNSMVEIKDALKATGVSTEYWNPIFVCATLKSLHPSIREPWEMSANLADKAPTMGDLVVFLRAKAKSLEASVLQAPPKAGTFASTAKVAKPAPTTRTVHVASPAPSTRPDQAASSKVEKYPCDHCQGAHFVVECPTFRLLRVPDRFKVVEEKRLCYNCFGHHTLIRCTSTRTCKACGRKHHTMIHEAIHHHAPQHVSAGSATMNKTIHRASLSTEPIKTIQTDHLASSSSTLLATAQAQIITNIGSHPVRLLIDPGSELSFISTHCVRTYHLRRQHSTIPISGIGNSQTIHTKGLVRVQIKSTHSSESVIINAHALIKLTTILPSVATQHQKWEHLSNLQLADPEFTTPRPVDIIIGADVYGQIIRPGIKKNLDSEPIALATIFGWIVLGPVQGAGHQERHAFHTSVCPSDQEIQDLLAKFWTQEEVQSSTCQISPEEQACEDHFKATHSRDETGRFIVRIPLNSQITALGESRRTAERCLIKLQRRLSKNSSYSSLYTSFMREYLELGHMRLVPHEEASTSSMEIGSRGSESEMTLAHEASASGGLRVSPTGSLGQSLRFPYYLPHHGVLKESSTTTKLRVVFNGSSPSSSGASINDFQHVGPKIQRDIADILIWIRQFKYIFATDITKMYRQIKVHEDDWDLQRILWVDEQQRMVPFHLTTVTYGTRSAPFLAVRSLLQLVEDEGHRFPLAIQPLQCGRYVDDIFGGAEQISDLIEISSQVIQLCKSGGFPLAKWHSNNKHFLTHVSEQSIEHEPIAFEDSTTKLLGLSWAPHHDQFTFLSTSPPSSSNLTKRIILSETAQLFDPLRFLSPFIVRAKILLQELWLEKLSWDEPVSSNISRKWQAFREELDQVGAITIPRWLHITSKSTLELHGFSDASQMAMAAVIYIKATDPGQPSRVTLVCSKSKVAPLKRMSIPRLELTAALLLARLMRYVKQTLSLSNLCTYLWTDSSVTLTWIKSHPSRWKDFVRNRVSAIQDLTPSSVWRFVPGKINPADCASRGLSISQLQKHQLWWTGPQWLITDQLGWPDQSQPPASPVHEEERPGLSFLVAVNQSSYHWEMIYRQSTMTKLLRVTAICFRVCRIIRKLPESTLGYPLTPQDLDQSRVFWIKATQAAFMSQEIKLISNQGLPPSHPFNSLTAFIDTQGILRVGGRLKNAPLDHEAIHPAILPRHSHFTQLVISEAHKRTLHGGTQITLNHIRRKYWIIGGRQPVRSHILRCISCARQRGVRAQQLMGQLPVSRVTPSRPFFTTGVDYAGPLHIKTRSGRGAKTYKGWLCIFVCFVTSAVHLEVVSDYSADAFIAAFRRFTGRRGICHTLRSDCGSNFIGADATIKELFTKGTQQFKSVACSLSNDGTTWKFNPPAAPHMGGKWEAAVKSVKHHLRRTVGESTLTFEELTTLLVQIEAILNSRPLEPLTDDPEDIAALTPAHFIIGEPLTAIPEPSLLDTKQNRLSRWQFIQQRVQSFWAQWSAQYLQRQLSISKWYHPSHEINVGSLVLITDERLPPSKWPLARVTQVHPGKDGLIRVATLKTATTSLTRPITKLAVLPVSSHEDSTKEEITNTVADGGGGMFNIFTIHFEWI